MIYKSFIMIYGIQFWKFEINDNINILMHNELFLGRSMFFNPRSKK